MVLQSFDLTYNRRIKMIDKQFDKETFRFDLSLVCLHGLDNLVIIFYRNTDLIHNLEASLFTHGLYFTDDLADKSLFDQLRLIICMPFIISTVRKPKRCVKDSCGFPCASKVLTTSV